MEMLVADPKGEWYLSKARFGFTDPLTGVRFEPGVLVKAPASDWLKAQAEAGVIVKTDDPTKAPAEPAKADKPKA